MGHNESNAKRKTHGPECLSKETGEIIHYQLNDTPESPREKKKLIHAGGVEDRKSSNSGLKLIK